MSDELVRWGHASSRDAEHWVGAFRSRQECEEEALTYYEEGEEVWISEGRVIVAHEHINLWVNAERIVEEIDELAAEETAAEDALFTLKAGGDEALKKLLVEWAKEYVDDNGWWSCREMPIQIGKAHE